jgi:5'(3')-deoxyribonucleotidase
MFREMPVMPGAADALWRLSDAGVWIRIITHRLYVNWGHAVAVADTVEWLDKRAIPYRDICFLGNKPEVEADCYVDDSPTNVQALRDADNLVIVYDAPYNRDLDGPRASTWDDVERLVTEAAAAKGMALQGRLPGIDDGAQRLRERLAP